MFRLQQYLGNNAVFEIILMWRDKPSINCKQREGLQVDQLHSVEQYTRRKMANSIPDCLDYNPQQ